MIVTICAGDACCTNQDASVEGWGLIAREIAFGCIVIVVGEFVVLKEESQIASTTKNDFHRVAREAAGWRMKTIGSSEGTDLVDEAAGAFLALEVLLPNSFFGMEKNFVIPRREVI